MSKTPVQENGCKNNSADNANKNSEEKKSLSFKDWKALKQDQNKTKDKSQYKSKNNKNIPNVVNDNRNNYDNNICYNSTRNFQGVLNFAASNGNSNLMPPNNFNGVNNNMCGFRGNRYGPVNIGLNNWSGSNNNAFVNRFCGSNFRNSGPINTSVNDCNRLNSLNEFNSFNPPEGFFATDAIYRQKDLMQQPLPNPFRNEQKAKNLLQEFDKSRYTKEDKKKKNGNRKPNEAKKISSNTNNQQNNIGDIKKLSEPKVYVTNPNSKKDGKPYIPKPKIPEENFEISKEEKRQQWKEYRDAMKPFKNREFYNAKRVVQRLGKMPLSDLDDKQIIRLSNARGIMNAHKARLSAKYPNYVKADESSNDLGELYVLKRQPIVDAEFGEKYDNQNRFDNNIDEYSSSGNSESEKIGYESTGFKGFVAGGIMKST